MTLTEGAITSVQTGLATSSVLSTVADAVAGLDGASIPTAADIVAALLAEGLGFAGTKDVTVLEAFQAVWASCGGSGRINGDYLEFYRPDDAAVAFRFLLDDPATPTQRTREWAS